MKEKESYLSRVLKKVIMGIGSILVVLLIFKAAGQADFSKFKIKIEEIIEQNMTQAVDFLWGRSYPSVTTYQKKDGASPFSTIFSTVPLYRFANEERDQEGEYEEMDPAYKRFRDTEKFYQEHEYLFQYGDEESNGGNEIKTEISEGMENPSLTITGVGDASPVHTRKEDMQVIGKQFVKAQLADYDFLMKNFYNVHSSTTADRSLMNAEAFLSKDFTIQGGNENPQILIYHTHSQERFADYGPDKKEATVVGMGAYLTQLLREKGYNVIHDTSVYDLREESLDRNKAYTYALAGVSKILQENSSIEVVLDLHRDGVKEGIHLVSEVNGKPTAPIMFFNGISQTPQGPIEYLPNPYREDNLAFSFQMQLDAAAYYPGLTRKIYIKGLRYNMHLRQKSALIEVGAQTNTYEEALNAMDPLAQLLDMVLQGD